MNKLVSILFYLKRTKNHSEGSPIPIYVRITVDNLRSEVSTGRDLNPDMKWNSAAGRAEKTTPDAKLLNAYLDSIQVKLHEAHRQLLDAGELITAEAIKNKYSGKGEKPRSLTQIFEQHNRQMESLIGSEFANGTLVNFKTTLKHLKSFLFWKFHQHEIDIRKINYAFIADLDYYLRAIAKLSNNVVVKNIRNFGKIVRICIASGWLQTNPFLNYKGRMKEVEIECLDQQELDTIREKDFGIERLNLVRDIFIFSCYTGLAYIEVKNLNETHMSLGIDGGRWIFIRRQKTEKLSRIPLLEIPETILTKYRGHKVCKMKDCLLPILTNQKMNAYLKEIADICKIKKDLTFHVARHTFATTVTLNNGVAIEAVSDMLGHSSLKQTQHYAKVKEKMISEEMKKLRLKNNSAGNLVAITKTGT
jgi:site-specific recombinase XerD